MTRTDLRFLVFPAGDTALRNDVAAAIEALPDGVGDDTARILAERQLRRMYRSLRIQPRDEFGGYPDDPSRVWYVFRDGRIRRPNLVRDRLYRALAEARLLRHQSEDAILAARVAGGEARPSNGSTSTARERTSIRR